MLFDDDIRERASHFVEDLLSREATRRALTDVVIRSLKSDVRGKRLCVSCVRAFSLVVVRPLSHEMGHVRATLECVIRAERFTFV